jgi:hypothetical protein
MGGSLLNQGGIRGQEGMGMREQWGSVVATLNTHKRVSYGMEGTIWHILVS